MPQTCWLQIDDADARHLSQLGLTKLYLEGMDVDTVLSERFAADGLAPLTTLRVLHLAWVADSFGDAALRRLAALTNLEELVLNRCDGVAGPGIAALAAACTRLRMLDWRRSEQDVAAALDAVVALPALRVVQLSSTPPQLSVGRREPQPPQEPSFLAPPAPQQAAPHPQPGSPPSRLHSLFVQHCDMGDEQLAARIWRRCRSCAPWC